MVNGMLWIVLTDSVDSGIYLRTWSQLCDSATKLCFQNPADRLVPVQERHFAKHFIREMKWFRRITTRYDKMDASFFAFVQLTSIAVLLI